MPGPQFRTLTPALFDRLWRSVLARCDELNPLPSPRNGSRSPAMVDVDGRGVSAILTVWLPDGTGCVHHVQARQVARATGGARITVTHTTWQADPPAQLPARTVAAALVGGLLAAADRARAGGTR
jgi:hypothetical protein